MFVENMNTEIFKVCLEKSLILARANDFSRFLREFYDFTK